MLNLTGQRLLTKAIKCLLSMAFQCIKNRYLQFLLILAIQGMQTLISQCMLNSSANSNASMTANPNHQSLQIATLYYQINPE